MGAPREKKWESKARRASQLALLAFVSPSAQSLTTCEVCGACFETRKGLSSHARSHLRQLGVAESESSGAPIDLLYELVKQKGLPDTPLGLPPGLTKKSSSPKEVVAGVPRQGLLTLAKPLDVPAVNKAIKSPPGFSAKGLAHPPSSPLLKKAPLALTGSPTPKNPEDKSPQLSLSPRPASPKAQWPQSEDEGPLNLSEFGSWELREVLALGERGPRVGPWGPGWGQRGSQLLRPGLTGSVLVLCLLLGWLCCILSPVSHFALLPPEAWPQLLSQLGSPLPLKGSFWPSLGLRVGAGKVTRVPVGHLGSCR